jgi:O-antigen ligase
MSSLATRASALHTRIRDGAWRHATAVAILAIAIVDIRLHEGVPLLWPLRLALVSAVGGTVLVLINSRPEALRRAMHDPLLKLTALYFGWAAVSAPLGIYASHSISNLRALLPTLLTQFLVLAVPTDRVSLHKILRGTVVAAALGGVLSFVVGRSSGDGRLSGVGSFDANDLAAIMALVVPIGLGMMSRARGAMTKVFYAGMVAMIVATMAATASRGGVIAIFVALAVFIAGQRGVRRFAFLVVAVIGAAATWSFASPMFKDRIGSMFSEGVNDYNYTAYAGRKQIWARGRGYVLNRPIAGVGFANFAVAEGRECVRRGIRGCKWSAPHNAYIQSAAELGVPGFLLFCTVLVGFGRVAFELWRAPRGRTPDGREPVHLPELLAALCGFAAAAYFLSFAYFFMLFGLGGMIGLARRIQLAERAEVPASPQAVPAGPAPARYARQAGRRGGLARLGPAA